MQTVLVVEDEQIQQKIYAKTFEDGGYKVLLAKDGEEALAVALKEQPNLIVLDSLLPIMNGAEVLAKLRKDAWGKEAKVIFLTNKDADGEERNMIMANNPVAYLTKFSIEPKDLLAKVKEALA